MLFDTDVLIFVQRGNKRAARLIQKAEERYISVQTYMELLQDATDKKQHEYIHTFLKDFHFRVLPFTENIGHRASIYIEEFSLKHGIRAGDAFVAATAVETGLRLSSSNRKHFKAIRELNFSPFSP